MSDNIDKDEIRKAIDRLQIEHPCNIAYDPIAFVNMEAVNTTKRCIDQIAKRMTEDTEINIICEFAKLYLDGVKPIVERPHGEWIPFEWDDNYSTKIPLPKGSNSHMEEYWDEEFMCSVCGKSHHARNFCPNCGADMREGDMDG